MLPLAVTASHTVTHSPSRNDNDAEPDRYTETDGERNRGTDVREHIDEHRARDRDC